MKAQYITVDEVSKALGISRSKSYQIIRNLNKELKDMGYITIWGKCPMQYFKQKFYGFQASRCLQSQPREAQRHVRAAQLYRARHENLGRVNLPLGR